MSRFGIQRRAAFDLISRPERQSRTRLSPRAVAAAGAYDWPDHSSTKPRRVPVARSSSRRRALPRMRGRELDGLELITRRWPGVAAALLDAAAALLDAAAALLDAAAALLDAAARIA